MRAREVCVQADATLVRMYKHCLRRAVPFE